MAEDGYGEFFDHLGGDIVFSLEEGFALAGAHEGQGGSWAGAEEDVFMFAGGADDLDDIVF